MRQTIPTTLNLDAICLNPDLKLTLLIRRKEPSTPSLRPYDIRKPIRERPQLCQAGKEDVDVWVWDFGFFDGFDEAGGEDFDGYFLGDGGVCGGVGVCVLAGGGGEDGKGEDGNAIAFGEAKDGFGGGGAGLEGFVEGVEWDLEVYDVVGGGFDNVLVKEKARVDHPVRGTWWLGKTSIEENGSRERTRLTSRLERHVRGRW